MAKCFKWLNALPLSRYNFKLNKSEFRDGIYLGYGWEPTKTPLTCACGANFNLTHALHCAKGGYAHIRLNKIRDTFANLMNEVWHASRLSQNYSRCQARQKLFQQFKYNLGWGTTWH